MGKFVIFLFENFILHFTIDFPINIITNVDISVLLLLLLLFITRTVGGGKQDDLMEKTW